MTASWKFAALAVFASVLADTPPSAPVRIDAVAVDRLGRPVTDLRPSELEIRVNGVAQAPRQLTVRVPSAGASTPELPPLMSRDDEVRAAGQPGTRVFVFVLDEFHVSNGAPTERVRDAMTQFVDEHLRPADLAVVFKPLDPVSSIRFTRDRTALRAAAASFAGRKDDLSPRSAFEEQFIGHAPAAVTAARAQLVSVALTEVSLQLGELAPDRAAIVLVSEGFERLMPATRRQGRVPDLQGVVRAASRFNFTVYAFNPADAVASGSPEQARETATLEWLARQTGGALSNDGAKLAETMGRMSRELDAYYSVMLDPGVSDGRFRQVEIVSKRPGVEMRARPGYWAPLSSEITSLLARSTTPALTPGRALRRSRLINAWTGVLPQPGGHGQVVVSWVPAAGAGPKAVPPESVQLTARSGSGAVLFEGPVGPIGASEGARVVRFAAPAGRVELDMRIAARDGVSLDTDIRDIVVPTLGEGKLPLLMPAEILRAQSVREYREMVQNAEAAPTPIRVFRRADRLIVRVPAWSSDNGSLQIAASVLNRRGQVMRPLESLGWQSPGIMAFDFPLAWLAPGDYYIEVAARDSRGESRERLSLKITG